MPIQSPTGELRLGVIVDAAAQALAAMRPLPPAPAVVMPPADDNTPDTQNLVNHALGPMIEYTHALAEHRQKQQQLGAIGAIARAFLP